MSEHIVSAYNNELEELRLKVIQMGGSAEHSLSQLVSVMKYFNPSDIDNIIENENNIDNMMLEIKTYAVMLIAKRQPLAVDLREIITAIDHASNIERIGDLIENICKRLQKIDLVIAEKHIQSLRRLAEKTLKQLSQSLIAMTSNDIELVKKIWVKDDEIDEYYFSLYKDIIEFMQKDAHRINIATELLFIDKNFERIGDHATNIVENIFYQITGKNFDPNKMHPA